MVDSYGSNRRTAIVRAASEVFARDGYFDTRLVDIAAEAGCSVGTVYTYFEGRDELLREVFRQVEAEMKQTGEIPSGAGAWKSIAASNRSYLESYRKNAKFMGLLEQVSHADSEFRKLREERAKSFIQRNAHWLRSLRADGRLDPSVDVDMMAAALSATVSRMAYAAWVDRTMGDSEDLLERILATVNRIWWASLGIVPEWVGKGDDLPVKGKGV